MHNVSESLSSLLLHYRSLILQLGDIEIDIEENSHSYLTQWSDATTEVWELLYFGISPECNEEMFYESPVYIYKTENLSSRYKARNKWKYELVTPSHHYYFAKAQRLWIFIITIIAVKKCFANSSLRLGIYKLGKVFLTSNNLIS